MRWLAVGCAVVLALALGGCGGGGDDAGDANGQGAELSTDQAKVVDLVVSSAAGEGLAIDERCVTQIVSRMSDADAKAIADAGLDGEPELSAEADALGGELLDCVDRQSFIDALVADLATQGIVLDRQCVLDAVKDSDISDVVAGGDSLPAEVAAALEACVSQ